MIGYESRYRTCVLYKDGSEEFLGARPLLDTSPQPDDLSHVVNVGERVDLIAYRYYARTDLWWLVCDYNGIANPLTPLEPGTVLRLPSHDYVFMRILA